MLRIFFRNREVGRPTNDDGVIGTRGYRFQQNFRGACLRPTTGVEYPRIGASLQRSSASTGSSEFGAKTAGFQRNGHNNRNVLPLGAQTWMTTCCRSNKSSARSCFAELCAFMFYGSATACQGKYLGSVPLQSLLSFEAHAPVGINLQPARSLAHPERARFGNDSCRAAVLIKA